MNIAIIPARGGSKRIPKKNIKPFYGKPIIYWPIQLAKNSGLFDDIIVSTDDKKIKEIAIDCGASVPFIRSKNISDDDSTTADVMSHAAKWIKTNQPKARKLCCIYPTSVFFSISDLNKGYNILNEGDWHYSFSVCEFKSSVYRSFKKSKTGGIKMLFDKNYDKKTQDFPKVYFDAAQFYWSTINTWEKKKIVFSEKSYPVVLPSWRIQDIDEMDDFKRAEILFQFLVDNKLIVLDERNN